MKIAHFVPIGQQTWPPHGILVSDWSISKKSSPFKLLRHMNRNLVGSIYMYGRFCIKFPQSRMKGEWLSLQFLSPFDEVTLHTQMYICTCIQNRLGKHAFFSSTGHVSYCHHFSSVVRRPSVNISHFNLLLGNHWTNCNQILVEWSLDGPLPTNHNTIDHAVVTWKEHGTFREGITYPSPGDVLGRSISRTLGTEGSTQGKVTSTQPSP